MGFTGEALVPNGWMQRRSTRTLRVRPTALTVNRRYRLNPATASAHVNGELELLGDVENTVFHQVLLRHRHDFLNLKFQSLHCNLSNALMAPVVRSYFTTRHLPLWLTKRRTAILRTSSEAQRISTL